MFNWETLSYLYKNQWFTAGSHIYSNCLQSVSWCLNYLRLIKNKRTLEIRETNTLQIVWYVLVILLLSIQDQGGWVGINCSPLCDFLRSGAVQGQIWKEIWPNFFDPHSIIFYMNFDQLMDGLVWLLLEVVIILSTKFSQGQLVEVP